MGVELFLWGILEPNTNIYASICPWNHVKLIFKQDLCNFKNQIHTFFLAFEKLDIENELSLWFLIFNISNSALKYPLKPFSNAIGLTWFGFFKAKLCPISHDDLIMDWFSRANLYNLPRIIGSSFGSEIDIKKTTVCVLMETFYRIPIRCSERESYDDFPKVTYFRWNSGACKNLASTDHISENIANQDLKFLHKVT